MYIDKHRVVSCVLGSSRCSIPDRIHAILLATVPLFVDLGLLHCRRELVCRAAGRTCPRPRPRAPASCGLLCRPALRAASYTTRPTRCRALRRVMHSMTVLANKHGAHVVSWRAREGAHLLRRRKGLRPSFSGVIHRTGVSAGESTTELEGQERNGERQACCDEHTVLCRLYDDRSCISISPSTDTNSEKEGATQCDEDANRAGRIAYTALCRIYSHPDSISIGPGTSDHRHQ
jgi:hypothetical protein